MTPEKIVAARWFRSKHLPVAAVVETHRVKIAADASLAIHEVRFASDAPPERYLVPQGSAWATRLAEAMMGGATIAAGNLELVCTATPTGASLGALERLAPRALGVEQSNTSVALGDRLILKLFRLLEHGDNPDLEVSAFLADAGFAGTPALHGTAVLRDASGDAAVAMLQSFVASTGDGWSALLAALAADRDALELVTTIGALTADLHAVLASRPDYPPFPVRAATVAETAEWRASAERQLAGAVAALSGEAHQRLVAAAPAVRARLADSFGRSTGTATVQRVHGDYHLGQLLAREEGGYAVIDFEGEPARPLAERSLPGSPLRDVAGMLRSLDYAARTAATTSSNLDPDAWLVESRAAFLDAYARSGRVGPSELALIDAFELEKACYEVRYEAANRPDWLWLPLAAVERLVAAR